MAIGTNDTLPKFGTTDSVDDGSTSAITNNSYSVLADITAWTNDEDAPLANFVLACAFAVAVSVGSIQLFARPINIDATDEPATPDDNYPHTYLGSFPIDFDAGTGTFRTTIEGAKLPLYKTSQEIEFYIKNAATAQSISAGWELFITPYTYGPSA